MSQIGLYDEHGKRVKGIRVTVDYKRKHAPYRRFKLLNLDLELPIGSLTGLQGKVLLALLFAQVTLSTKQIAALVGATPSAACRALNGLVRLGLVLKVARGEYQVKSHLAYYGRWSVPDKLHPQIQGERHSTPIGQKVPE